MNLRTRFAIITGALVLVIATAMSIGAYRIAGDQLEKQVQTSLNQRASRILRIVADPNFSWSDSFGPGPVNQAIMQTEVDAITQVVLADGRVLGRREYPQLPVTKEDLALRQNDKRVHRSTTVIDGHSFRVLTVATPDGSLVQVAKDTQIIVRARNAMRTLFPLFATIAVMVASVIGWLFAGRVSRPIETLAETAGDIALTQDLNREIGVKGDGEVARLSRSFNTMLEALRGSVARQRQLVQDASHELRTPLTSLRANTELLERGSLSDAVRASILADMRAEIDELTDLSAELNSLATDQRAVEEPEIIDLSEVAEDVVTRASRRSTAQFSVHATNDLNVSARPHQLERAVSNLVENAIKFNVDDRPIEVHVGSKRIEVRDHGPGIADSDKPHVFDRFYRATATRSMPGSGLGLAIVAQFAQDNDAHVYVLDNAGGGTIVGIQFTK